MDGGDSHTAHRSDHPLMGANLTRLSLFGGQWHDDRASKLRSAVGWCERQATPPDF
jgi:hypothetical protein